MSKPVVMFEERLILPGELVHQPIAAMRGVRTAFNYWLRVAAQRKINIRVGDTYVGHAADFKLDGKRVLGQFYRSLPQAEAFGIVMYQEPQLMPGERPRVIHTAKQFLDEIFDRETVVKCGETVVGFVTDFRLDECGPGRGPRVLATFRDSSKSEART